MEPQQRRDNAPKDGYGPRGYPDCYYTSRVLDSTYRYVKFVKKLRAFEEEQRRGAINTLKELNDKQYSDFFIRCDRRSLINNVARRVDLCMTSYQEDLKAKRQRLIDLLQAEEEMNIRKFVEQAQAGAEALWEDKKERLAYLLAKRQKEHEEKYSDVPISKCVHALPCILKLQSKDTQDILLYQMRCNQARKIAEKEMDKMWYEVAMKESEALAARMEQDAIERYRRDQECMRVSDQQIAARKEQRRKEQERLKEESLMMKKMFDECQKKEDEESLALQAKRKEIARDRAEMMEQRKATLEQQKAEAKLINDTWDSLAGLGIADEKAKVESIKRKERELDMCNRKMAVLKHEKEKIAIEDNKLMEQEAQRQQKEIDLRRCMTINKSKKLNQEVRAGIVEQMKDNAAARKLQAKQSNDQDEYERQLYKQLQQLVEHKEMTDAQARKLFQKQLLEQIEYNKLLKERAWREELEQREKYAKAADQYQDEITKILCRSSFSEDVHPFMGRMMTGIKMQEKCPCSKPNYCADPVDPKKSGAAPAPGPAPKAITFTDPKASTSK